MANAAKANEHFPSSTLPTPLKSKHDFGSEACRNTIQKQRNNRIAYAKTWAEDVQNYHAAKSVLPWVPEQQQPVKYVTRHEKSREEREYDVVLGCFRNDEKELGCQQRESLKRKQNLDQGRAKQLRTIQRFNVISNEPMYPELKGLPVKQLRAQPFRTKHVTEYNILTTIPHNGVSVPTLSNNGPTLSKPQREFNILTNMYNDLHDVKFEQEVAQAKRLAAQKLDQTRTFDPVRVTFVNEDREKNFLIQRNVQQQNHGKDRVLLLPPRAQYAEGRLYTIVNQRVIDSEKLATMDKKEQRPLNKMKQTAFEAKMREAGSNQQARATDLCLNRFAHDRHVENRIHGYDVLSNQPYTGRAAKPLLIPRTHTALTAWQTIESGLLVGNRVAPSISSITSRARPLSIGHSDAAKTNILIIDQSPSSVQVLGNHPLRLTANDYVRTGGFGIE